MKTTRSFRAIALSILFAITGHSLAAPGNLDRTFGSYGRASTDFSNAAASGVAVQTDGKIIVVGRSMPGSSHFDFSVARLTTSGALDAGFGIGGKVTTDFNNYADYCTAVAIQSDGKIIAVGNAFNGANFDFALVRYSTAGAHDTSFGVGGKVTTPIGTGNATAYSVAIQADRKIVVTGNSIIGGTSRFTVARYTEAGALDGTFGTGGIVTSAISTSDAYAKSVAIQADQKILVAGSSSDGTKTLATLVRYTTTGTLDTSFADAGKTTVGFNPLSSSASDVAIQDDQKLVIAGTSEGYQFSGFAVARYNPDGTLDDTFGNFGKVTTYIVSPFAGFDGKSLAIQANGRILVAGYSSGAFALIRYNKNGTLDTSFSYAGISTIYFYTHSAFAEDMALQDDGRILVVGGGSDQGDVFAIARYQGDGPSHYSIQTASSPTDGGTTSGGASKKVGSTATVIASPNPGYTFSRWTVGSKTVSTTATYAFTVQSARTLIANFTPLVNGTYFVTIRDNNGASRGTISAKLTSGRNITGVIVFDGKHYRIKGSTDPVGHFTLSITRSAGLPSLAVQLDFQSPNNAGQMTAAITEGAITFLTTGEENLATLPANITPGKYTVHIPATGDGATSPGGSGYALATLDKTGSLKLIGKTPGSTAFTLSAQIRSDHSLEFLIPLYKAPKGTADGTLTFATANTNAFEGTLRIAKPPQLKPGKQTYPLGFTSTFNIIGSTYTPPKKGTSALTESTISTDKKCLLGTPVITIPVTVSNADILTPKTPGTENLKAKFTRSNGKIIGTFTDPDTLSKRRFEGVLLQNTKTAFGFILTEHTTQNFQLTAP